MLGWPGGATGGIFGGIFRTAKSRAFRALFLFHTPLRTTPLGHTEGSAPGAGGHAHELAAPPDALHRELLRVQPLPRDRAGLLLPHDVQGRGPRVGLGLPPPLERGVAELPQEAPRLRVLQVGRRAEEHLRVPQMHLRTDSGAGGEWAGMQWKEGGGGNPLPPSRASLCPATVPLTPSAGFSGICNRQ